MPKYQQDSAHVNTEQLRHLVELQSKVKTGTGTRGEAVYTWETKCGGTVPAYVNPMGGRELELARQIVENATHKIIIRYVAGIDTTWRVLFDGTAYNIGNISDPEFRHRTLVLLCFTET